MEKIKQEIVKLIQIELSAFACAAACQYYLLSRGVAIMLTSIEIAFMPSCAMAWLARKSVMTAASSDRSDRCRVLDCMFIIHVACWIIWAQWCYHGFLDQELRDAANIVYILGIGYLGICLAGGLVSFLSRRHIGKKASPGGKNANWPFGGGLD